MELPKNKLLNIDIRLFLEHNQEYNNLIIILFKIDTQHNKSWKSLTYSLGIFNIERIDKVISFMFHNVAQPETKLQLGYQFEKRQINIAPYSHFEIRVISIETQQIVPFFRDVASSEPPPTTNKDNNYSTSWHCIWYSRASWYKSISDRPCAVYHYVLLATPPFYYRTAGSG